MKNNIFYNNDSSDYNQVYIYKGKENLVTALDYNTYYYTGQKASVYYDSDDRDITYMQDQGLRTNGEDTDPGFTKPGPPHDVFILDGTNIDDGDDDISQCF